MVWMVHFSSEPQRFTINNGPAFLAHVFAFSCSFDFVIAFMAQSTTLIFYETKVCQFLMAHFTTETFWMPGSHHCLDDSTNNKFSTFATAGSKENMEIMFTVFSAFKFVENPFREWTETLGTYKTFWMVQFPVGVDNFRFWFEAIVTSSTTHAFHVYNTRKWRHS
jgi:hypothetical protein